MPTLIAVIIALWLTGNIQPDSILMNTGFDASGWIGIVLWIATVIFVAVNMRGLITGIKNFLSGRLKF